MRNRYASTVWRATAPVLAVHGGTGRIVGEALILSVFAHEVDALIRLAGLSLGAACQQALHDLESRAGTGGCIAVGPDGTVAMPFTSAGMFRGAVDATSVRKIGMCDGQSLEGT